MFHEGDTVQEKILEMYVICKIKNVVGLLLLTRIGKNVYFFVVVSLPFVTRTLSVLNLGPSVGPGYEDCRRTIVENLFASLSRVIVLL